VACALHAHSPSLPRYAFVDLHHTQTFAVVLFTIQLASKLLRSNQLNRSILLPPFLSYISAILCDSRPTFQWPALLIEAAAVSLLKLLCHSLPITVATDATRMSVGTLSGPHEVQLFSLFSAFLNADFSQPSLCQQVL
jgi:hypothetical protein